MRAIFLAGPVCGLAVVQHVNLADAGYTGSHAEPQRSTEACCPFQSIKQRTSLAWIVISSLIHGSMKSASEVRNGLRRCFSRWQGPTAGFDRAFGNLGAAPCHGPDAQGACPLLLCNVVCNVLVNS